MPSRNMIRDYLAGGIYHIYNRGINRKNIFIDKRDYATFLFYLKLYLEDPEKLKNLDPQKRSWIKRNNFYGRIELLCYCLMPNHFHLVVKQTGEKDFSEFMRCVTLNYSMYFNDKYMRVGPLFQSRFKAILVKNDNYLLHLTRYIHMNPISKDLILDKLSEYEYSSYADYLGKKETKWVKPKLLLDYFENNKGDGMIDITSYQKFVEEYVHDTEKILRDITLE